MEVVLADSQAVVEGVRHPVRRLKLVVVVVVFDVVTFFGLSASVFGPMFSGNTLRIRSDSRVMV